MNIRRLILFFILLTFSSATWATPVVAFDITAQQGVMDLSGKKAIEALVPLQGEWEFTWLSGQTELDPVYLEQPGSWKGKTIPAIAGPLPGQGAARYRLKILLSKELQSETLSLYIPKITSSYTFTINGKKRLVLGDVSTDSKQYKPAEGIYQLPLVSAPEIEIEIIAANYKDRFGGITKPLLLGKSQDITAYREHRLTQDLGIFGALFIMAIYHFVLYALRRKDPSTLVFGTFVMLIALRSLLNGEMYFSNLYPWFDFEWKRKIEYWTVYLSLPAFVWFLRFMYPLEFSRVVLWMVTIVSALYSLHVLFTSVSHFNQFLVYYQLLLVLTAGYSIYSIIQAALRKEEAARVALGGMLVFFAFILNDILHDHGVIKTGYFIPLGLFLFILTKSVILAIRFTHSFFATEQLSERLASTNKAYSLFVPQEVLRFLNRPSITNIALGDQIEREMTVLFTDIRNFTTLSERMTPEENFAFLNSYFHEIGPVIRRNNGFIDKYIGDAVMALFPGTPDDAIRAAYAIRGALEHFNKMRREQDLFEVEAGVGVHFGKLMLGTIGENERMDATVISDAVNTASRLEGLTKSFRTPIIISMDTLHAAEAEVYAYRSLGRVKVKGRSAPVEIAELLDLTHGGEKAAVKQKHRETFAHAVALFEEHKMEEALSLFDAVLRENPEDGPAAYYADRLRVRVRQTEEESFS